MIRIATRLESSEIIRALHAQPRDVLLEFARDLLVGYKDATLLEDLADMVLAELERRASGA